MANNRLYLKCVFGNCTKKEKFYLAKYYPNIGWYSRRENIDVILDEWFDKHRHGDLLGDFIKLGYESEK